MPRSTSSSSRTRHAKPARTPCASSAVPASRPVASGFCCTPARTVPTAGPFARSPRPAGVASSQLRAYGASASWKASILPWPANSGPLPRAEVAGWREGGPGDRVAARGASCGLRELVASPARPAGRQTRDRRLDQSHHSGAHARRPGMSARKL